jgi:hypothetical protein
MVQTQNLEDIQMPLTLTKYNKLEYKVQGHCNCKRSRFNFRIFHLFTLRNKVVIIKLLDQTKKNTVAHYKK